jgi:16S rRNA (uracil1498-N3)-methyltransferase
MQLFYNKHISEGASSYVFNKEESKHIIKVLRKKENDILFVTNGLGHLFETKISLASDTKCMVSIIYFEKQNKPNFKLHLAVAPTKMNERFEWFLEKATEIGIQEITPIFCDNSERKIVKTERFLKIIESAMKQSLHCFLPKLNEPVTFKEFLNKEVKGQKFIAHCEHDSKKSLKNELKKCLDTTILIGPEGDFSVKEIALALQNNYNAVSLGNTRLRTETAAIVACHSVIFANE